MVPLSKQLTAAVFVWTSPCLIMDYLQINTAGTSPRGPWRWQVRSDSSIFFFVVVMVTVTILVLLLVVLLLHFLKEQICTWYCIFSLYLYYLYMLTYPLNIPVAKPRSLGRLPLSSSLWLRSDILDLQIHKHTQNCTLLKIANWLTDDAFERYSYPVSSYNN